MGRIRWAVAAATVAGSTLGVPAAVSAPVPALAGTTVIRASRPVVADVRLTRAASFATPFGPSPDLSVAAHGRLSAFVLVGTAGKTYGVTVVGGAEGPAEFLMPVPLYPAPGGGTFDAVKGFADKTTIPAGSYRLYVVPDGGPATFTLTLHGLTGRTAIAPAKAATAEVAVADPWPADSAVKTNVFATSVNRRLVRRGFAMQVLRSRIEASVAWQIVMCHNNPATDPVKTVPGCPEGDKRAFSDKRAPETQATSKLFAQGFAGLPAGDHGLGTIYTTEGVATSVDYATLWIAY